MRRACAARDAQRASAPLVCPPLALIRPSSLAAASARLPESQRSRLIAEFAVEDWRQVKIQETRRAAAEAGQAQQQQQQHKPAAPAAAAAPAAKRARTADAQPAPSAAGAPATTRARREAAAPGGGDAADLARAAGAAAAGKRKRPAPAPAPQAPVAAAPTRRGRAAAAAAAADHPDAAVDRAFDGLAPMAAGGERGASRKERRLAPGQRTEAQEEARHETLVADYKAKLFGGAAQGSWFL